ncbi:hypothetical protein JTB14_008231 [Gonioctena quinquepunctata]|nr:hypothetical protein JTB14_008231 [Gonioctena quinquepunctata]
METEFTDPTKIVSSFLHARDPSILAWNRAALEKVKVNLEDILDATGQTTICNKENEDKCIRVYLRLKGGVPYENLYEIDTNKLICKVPEGSYSMRHLKYGNAMTRTYTFTKIFRPMVLGFINGRNSTLFTYGASGSGKTFTIVGTPAEPGLIPRALEYIFRTLPKMDDQPPVKPLPNGSTTILDHSMLRFEKSNKSTILNATVPDKATHTKTYRQMQERLSSEPVAKIDDLSNICVNLWVSFAEIYNESIHDLLIAVPKGKQRPKLALGQTNGQTYIKKLTAINVSDGMEAYQILQFGIHNLNYAATAINSHSSRSHCIFTIKLVQTSKFSDEICVSSFNFCDLAGSERSKKTLNIGDRLKESNNINTSLLVLGRCIENIRCLQQIKDKRLVPFRESKLTQLFQRALMGFENLEMMVNINPSRDMFDETHQALNFAAIAKEIIVEEQPSKPIRKKNRFSNMIENTKERSESIDVEQLETVDPREYERIKIAYTDLYNEFEQYKEEQYKDVEVEKEYVAKLYKEHFARKEKQLEEEKVKAVARAVNQLKEQHRREMDRFREELKNTAANGDDSVISINDSSAEESSPTKVSPTPDNREEIQDLKRQIVFLEVELSDRTETLRKSKQNQTLQERRLRELEDELDQVKIQLEDRQSFIKDAEVAYASLLEENKYLKENRRKLVSENILLEEKYESMQSTYTRCDSPYSDEEDDDATLPRGASFETTTDCTPSVSKIRLNEEDKKLF